MTRVTSSRAIASREACSSALARSPESSSIRLRSRSASARAAASRRRSSSISEPIPVSFPPNTTVEDQSADQLAIRKNRWPQVPSEEPHPYQVHYNTARPHQRIAQRVPDGEHDDGHLTIADLDRRPIHRNPVLGGLINEYSRAA